MNGLTVNMGLLLLGFYQPEEKRDRILIEDIAFPSDRVLMLIYLTDADILCEILKHHFLS